MDSWNDVALLDCSCLEGPGQWLEYPRIFGEALLYQVDLWGGCLFCASSNEVDCVEFLALNFKWVFFSFMLNQLGGRWFGEAKDKAEISMLHNF